MNSIPQQEVANGKGQSEFFRASPTARSREVAKNPGPSNPSGPFSIFTVDGFNISDISDLVQCSIFDVQCLKFKVQGWRFVECFL
jgi:hypothetical protein